MWSDKFKISASYEPAVVATSSMNYCFYFPFSLISVRNLKEVYEQVNALKFALFKSTSTTARGNRP